MTLPVYSKVYLEVENDDWTVTPTTSLLQKIHQGHQSSVRWIAVLHYKQKEYRIAVGDPVRDTSQVLFAPPWFLHTMGVIGDGESMEVTFERAETLPKATRLCFRVIGDNSTMPEGIDIRDVLETPLSQLGVIMKNQTIPIPISDFHSLQVIECEPADCVFLDGNDVAFEVEEPESIIERSRQATPFVSPTHTPFSTPMFASNGSMFDGPMISTISNASEVLRMNPRATTQRQFISFQGNGRTLSEK
jgi:hypothetical protein